MKESWAKYMAVFSSLLCLLWLAGMGLVLNNHFRSGDWGAPVTAPPNLEAAPDVKQDGVDVLALGDSLTRGTGDSEGKGYVGYLLELLQEQSTEEILLSNLAIKGLTSSELREQVKQEEVQRQITEAESILVTIGGNDLFLGGQTLLDLDLNKVEQLEEEYLNNVRTILTDIRALNNQATIYFIGLYNPFSLLGDGKLTSEIVLEWNAKTAALTLDYPKTIFVPTYDLFQLEVESYLYSDKFHPNAEGYRLIAERLRSLIRW